MRARLTAGLSAVAGGAALAIIALLTSSAHAGAATPTYPYEVTVAWQMSSVPNIPINTPEPNGPFNFPQTRLDGIPQPECNVVVPVQVDTYTIKNADDASYLAGLKTLSSSADDQRLSPHDYYAEVITKAASDCESSSPPLSSSTPPPSSSTPPPTSSSPPVSSTPPMSSSPPVSSSTPPKTSSPATSTSSTSSESVGPPISISRTPPTPRKLVAHNTPLASTGSHTGELLALSLLLLVAGVGLLLLGGKRGPKFNFHRRGH